jgi:hypothetical protein
MNKKNLQKKILFFIYMLIFFRIKDIMGEEKLFDIQQKTYSEKCEDIEDFFSLYSLSIKKSSPFSEVSFIHAFNHRNPPKEWTVLIYIAGDNDLYRFALRNIEQMKQLGSSEHLNILVHFDFHEYGSPKESRRLYIEKNKIYQIGNIPPMDSGDPKTLIDAYQWAQTHYPSRNFGLILWNHGTGCLEPRKVQGVINPSDLFKYNEETKLIEIDRSISFMDYLEEKSKERGICFDLTTGNYLDGEKLSSALKTITNQRGKKIDILLMDACLMGCLEVAYGIFPYVNFLCSSQEVVLGPGYNYSSLLAPLTKGNISPHQFALHAVVDYQKTYSPITDDYTQAAYNLEQTNNLIKTITLFAETCNSAIQNKTILKALQAACKENNVMRFEEPSYADLKHFFDNVLFVSDKLSSSNPNNIEIVQWAKKIQIIIQQFYTEMSRFIIKNACGKNASKAHGVSIYLPTKSIHQSYPKILFNQKNGTWMNFIFNLIK